MVVGNHQRNAANLNQSKAQFHLELSLAQFSPRLFSHFLTFAIHPTYIVYCDKCPLVSNLCPYSCTGFWLKSGSLGMVWLGLCTYNPIHLCTYNSKVVRIDIGTNHFFFFITLKWLKLILELIISSYFSKSNSNLETLTGVWQLFW